MFYACDISGYRCFVSGYMCFLSGYMLLYVVINVLSTVHTIVCIDLYKCHRCFISGYQCFCGNIWYTFNFRTNGPSD